MATIKNILFDFDGTLADTATGIVATMVATFEQMGIPLPTESAMRATIGLPLNESLQMLGGLNEPDTQLATDTYRELFPTYAMNSILVFPKVTETLEQLHQKGIRMAIVTSRREDSLNLIMDKHGISSFFETRASGSTPVPPKPAPDMVLYLLNKMSITADETLVVGDTTYDIEMGNRAGCHTCAVTYGNHSLEKLLTTQPDHVIDQFSDILTLIAGC